MVGLNGAKIPVRLDIKTVEQTGTDHTQRLHIVKVRLLQQAVIANCCCCCIVASSGQPAGAVNHTVLQPPCCLSFARHWHTRFWCPSNQTVVTLVFTHVLTLVLSTHHHCRIDGCCCAGSRLSVPLLRST
jgi:hypothetical protein